MTRPGWKGLPRASALILVAAGACVVLTAGAADEDPLPS